MRRLLIVRYVQGNIQISLPQSVRRTGSFAGQAPHHETEAIGVAKK
jgi:hypothetical protein